MDNHIYLYYDRIHFELLLHCIDLEQIIQDNKFIFLIDESMKGNYPLDFKSEYGIDYEEMGVKEFHANELQRILFNRTYLYAGNHFLHDILNGSEQIVDIMNAVFYAESSKRMIRLYFHYTSNAEKIINIPEFILFLEKYKDEIAWECKNEVQNELVRLLIENEKGNLPFWKLWKWIIVAMIAVSHRFENKQYYNRVIPTVFWDAHLLEAQESHYSVLKSFKYPNIIGLVRDPIVALVRQVENLGPGTEYEFETLLMNCCTRAKDIPEYFMKCGYYIMRFEDLKRNPIPVLKKFCEKIQIPYSKGLLNGRAGIYYGSPVVNEKGEKIQGFDQRTVMRDMSESIPPFDQARLDIAYGRIKEILGYGTAVKWNYNKEELEIMFSIPFQFEKKHEETRKIIFEYLDKIENKLLRKAIERERGLSPERFRSILQKKLLELCVNEELYCYPIPKIIEK